MLNCSTLQNDDGWGDAAADAIFANGIGSRGKEGTRVEEGTGPKFIRLGLRRVGYHKADPDEWIAALRRHASTSEVQPALRGPGRPRKHSEGVA